MRLKAFTIIEIIVTLAISTFIIMVAMMAYFVVNKQFSEYKRLNDELKAIYEVNFLMQNDFNESEVINFNEKDRTMLFEGGIKIKYQLRKNEIIRSSVNSIDTFSIQHSNLECLGVENQLNEILVKSIKLNIKIKRSEIEWSIFYRNELPANISITSTNR